jgi:hypothetical protein
MRKVTKTFCSEAAPVPDGPEHIGKPGPSCSTLRTNPRTGYHVRTDAERTA